MERSVENEVGGIDSGLRAVGGIGLGVDFTSCVTNRHKVKRRSVLESRKILFI